MNKIEKIEKEILELKNELNQVTGTDTEIYARIVGYYRSVKNWNRGKKEEYRFRRDFNGDCACDSALTKKTDLAIQRVSNQTHSTTNEKITVEKSESTDAKESYLYFYRNSCPNCGPVKNYLHSLSEKTIEVNVDTAEGLKLAAKYDVMATPTAIWFDNQGNERFRGSSVNTLKKAVEMAC